MASLIITIISLAIFAIIAASAIYYGGQAFQQGQAQAWASAMINQNGQVVAAVNDWSLNHGGDTWGDVGFSDLVNQGYLSQWPNLVMMTPQPEPGGNVTTGSYEDNNFSNTCPVIDGYQGYFSRRVCSTTAGRNFIVDYMKLNDPYNGACSSQNAGHGYGFENASYAKHPYVQLANVVNGITHAVPATATIASSGLPYELNTQSYSCTSKDGSSQMIYADGNGNIQANYCYLGSTSGTSILTIICPFTQ